MKKEKYTLITNLEWVTIGPVRTFAHALLLEDEDDEPRGRRCRVRGFGTDSTWPVFDIFVDSVEYEIEDAGGKMYKFGDGGLVPIIRGGILKLKDGPEMTLVAQDRGRPLDIQTFEEQTGDTPLILDVWKALQRKVVEYWGGRLNIPLLSWQPVVSVKHAIENDSLHLLGKF